MTRHVSDRIQHFLLCLLRVLGPDWVPKERGREDEGGEEILPLFPPHAIELGKMGKREEERNPKKTSKFSLPPLNVSILVILPSM